MKPLDRALTIRESTARLRIREPRRLFDRRMKEADAVLEVVEKHAKTKATREEARRYHLVCLATAFEIYWREFFRELIDDLKPSESTFTHLRKVTFTMGELVTVLGRELTMGELISAAYSFQGADAVNAAASDILRIDVFAEFSKRKYEIFEIPRKNRSVKHGPPFRDVWEGAAILAAHKDSVNRCFEIRHDTVHWLGTKHRPTEIEPVMIGGAIHTFNHFLSAFIEKHCDQTWK